MELICFACVPEILDRSPTVATTANVAVWCGGSSAIGHGGRRWARVHPGTICFKLLQRGLMMDKGGSRWMEMGIELGW